MMMMMMMMELRLRVKQSGIGGGHLSRLAAQLQLNSGLVAADAVAVGLPLLSAFLYSAFFCLQMR